MYNDVYQINTNKGTKMSELLNFGELAYETLPTADEQILAIDQDIAEL